MPFDIKEIRAKSILSPSQLKDSDYDYSLNPYLGCRFGCVYCYASFMGRFVGKKVQDWGEYVFAKVNAPELLKKEITKIPHKGEGKWIWFSSVTDPYQALELKYRLTRACLHVLVEYGFRGGVSFLTKSPLVLEDLPILKKLHTVEVGMTITSTDDSISRYFEKFAPPASARLKALKKLNDEGIKTYAFIGPLLPHYVAQKQTLDKLMKAIHDTGVRDVYVEHINLSSYILNRLKHEVEGIDPEILKMFYASKTKEYRHTFDRIVPDLLRKNGLRIRLGGTLYHKDMK